VWRGSPEGSSQRCAAHSPDEPVTEMLRGELHRSSDPWQTPARGGEPMARPVSLRRCDSLTSLGEAGKFGRTWQSAPQPSSFAVGSRTRRMYRSAAIGRFPFAGTSATFRVAYPLSGASAGLLRVCGFRVRGGYSALRLSSLDCHEPSSATLSMPAPFGWRTMSRRVPESLPSRSLLPQLQSPARLRRQASCDRRRPHSPLERWQDVPALSGTLRVPTRRRRAPVHRAFIDTRRTVWQISQCNVSGK
jgi:hypothetical protein